MLEKCRFVIVLEKLTYPIGKSLLHFPPAPFQCEECEFHKRHMKKKEKLLVHKETVYVFEASLSDLVSYAERRAVERGPSYRHNVTTGTISINVKCGYSDV